MGKDHDSYDSLFAGLTKVSPAETLLGRILQRIEEVRGRRARIRLGIVCGLAVTFSTSLVVSGAYAVHEIAQSNASSYFSLIFSDTAALAVVWKEFGLSVVDSVPLMGLTLFSAAALALLLSLRLGFRYTNKTARFA